MIGWLISAVALACGGMFGPDGGEVFSDAQQVVFERDADSVQVTYSVRYGGDQPDFGWVIPIRGDFLELEEASAHRFDALREASSPQPTYHAEEGGGGCGPTAKSGSNDALRSGGTDVTVVASGVAGVFEYTAISADSVVAITEWLDTNGWTVGPSLPALEAYVQEGGWTFVAVGLIEELAGEGGGETAVQIRYSGAEMRFPARMSRYSTAVEQATTIYVVGDQRAHLTSWGLTDLPEGKFVGDWRYEDALRDVVGGEMTFAVVFANEVDGEWVTRFDTLTPSAVHEDDPQFLIDGGIVSYVPEIDVYASERALEDSEEEGGCAVVDGRAASLAWLLAAAAILRRRRG